MLSVYCLVVGIVWLKGRFESVYYIYLLSLNRNENQNPHKIYLTGYFSKIKNISEIFTMSIGVLQSIMVYHNKLFSRDTRTSEEK